MPSVSTLTSRGVFYVTSRVNYVSLFSFLPLTRQTRPPPIISHIGPQFNSGVMSAVPVYPISHLFCCPVFINYAWRTTLFTPDTALTSLHHHYTWRLKIEGIMENTASLSGGTKLFLTHAKARVDEYVGYLIRNHRIAFDLGLSPTPEATTAWPICMLGYKLRGHERQSFWQVFLLCVWIDRVLWAHDICPNSSDHASANLSDTDTDAHADDDPTAVTPALTVLQLRHPFTSTDGLEPLDHSQALNRCSRASVFLSKETETDGFWSPHMQRVDDSVFRTRMTFFAGTVHRARSETYAVSSNLFWMAGMAFTLMQVSALFFFSFFFPPVLTNELHFQHDPGPHLQKVLGNLERVIFLPRPPIGTR